MGKFATAFRGVWGQVVRVDHNPLPGRILGKPRVLAGGVVPGAVGGVNHTEIYIMTNLTNNGKRVVIKASPYELDGGLLDNRPVFVRGR